MTTFEIKQGNALDVLRSMESESVQCSITSPPYYGLRSYKTEPQIWDGDEFCDHEWTEKIKPAANGLVNNVMQGETLDGNSGTRSPSIYSDCSKCGAWRGELGLEPTFQLYLSHLLQIFTEVKRVVKPDGTIFINLGDSYAGSWANYVAEGSTSAKALDKRRKDRYGTFKPAAADRNGRMGIPAKSLMNIPHRFFIKLTDELGLIQRNNINWWKRACMPSSAKDRFTVDFESIGFFTKSARYKFNQVLEPLSESTLNDWRTIAGEWSDARPERGYNGSQQQATGMLKPTVGRSAKGGDGSGELGNSVRFGHNEVGRNCRTTWDFGFEPQSSEHYAAYPSKMCDRMILAGSDEGNTILDIFSGTASTGLSALRLKRNFVGIELNPDYIKIAEKRLAEIQIRLFS